MSTAKGTRFERFKEVSVDGNVGNEMWKLPVNYYQVIIIGAGMAGIGAALRLYENGCKNIKILEAKKEAGGRIKTIPLQNGFIDIGAQWIHGTDNNCLYRIAKEHNLLSDEMSEEGCGLYIRDDGFVFDSALVDEVNFELGKIILECEKFIDESTFPISVGNFLEDKFETYIERSKSDVEMKKELFDWHIKFLLVDNSCSSLEYVSAKEWGRYNGGPEHVNLKNGYKSLVDVLISMLPNKVLKYSSPVSRICWSNNKNCVRLYCVNGEEYDCDHVIVTVSLGVLKDSPNFFQPNLPNKMRETIHSMGFYGIAKIFLIYDVKWWNANGFQLVWRRKRKLYGSKKWLRYITGFDLVYNQPNILLGWVGGEGVPAMERLTETDIGLHCTELLTRILNSTVPNPSKVIRTKWMCSPWVRGGYCHITPQCDKTNTGPLTLSEPVFVGDVPRILLAGEACNSKHFSTTHGAFESGQMQAQRVLDYLK
ncbi:hypothetical protein RI129_000649 [Pyrocoelia pectoralis]|uniref:Amine oxidase domain-containing protein n=1 Tax=Pyrocoelia pectoralis TaxID=417401 RepID=A0AAN7VKQ0_9COLE